MTRLQPRHTRTDTLLPITTLIRATKKTLPSAQRWGRLSAIAGGSGVASSTVWLASAILASSLPVLPLPQADSARPQAARETIRGSFIKGDFAFIGETQLHGRGKPVNRCLHKAHGRDEIGRAHV